jgi:hypothetical protein
MLKGTRKANGQGYTYKNGSSYRTVIKHKGYTVTASAKTIQESKKIAKEKVKSLPYSEYGLILKQKITNNPQFYYFLNDFCTSLTMK